MIKIYRLKQVRNSVSHVLVGAGGNTMRYNFTGGSVVTGTCPELSLRSKYAQDLLEQSELFKSGTVVLVRVIKTLDEANDEAKVPDTPSPTTAIKNVDSADAVTSLDELLVYINTNYSKKFTDPSKALAFAAKESIIFPNLPLGN